jgi:hypothetical protein
MVSRIGLPAHWTPGACAVASFTPFPVRGADTAGLELLRLDRKIRKKQPQRALMPPQRLPTYPDGAVNLRLQRLRGDRVHEILEQNTGLMREDIGSEAWTQRFADQ